MNGVDNKCFDKQNSTLLVSDLSLSTSENWLNLEIINVFIKLINNSSTTGQVIFLSITFNILRAKGLNKKQRCGKQWI